MTDQERPPQRARRAPAEKAIAAESAAFSTAIVGAVAASVTLVGGLGPGEQRMVDVYPVATITALISLMIAVVIGAVAAFLSSTNHPYARTVLIRISLLLFFAATVGLAAVAIKAGERHRRHVTVSAAVTSSSPAAIAGVITGADLGDDDVLHVRSSPGVYRSDARPDSSGNVSLSFTTVAPANAPHIVIVASITPPAKIVKGRCPKATAGESCVVLRLP